MVVLFQAFDNSVYTQPFVDSELLSEERLANWCTSQMLVGDWVAAFSLNEGDLEMQQPADSFTADEVSEFTSHLQASYQMICMPKWMRFWDPEEKVLVKSEFLKLPATSMGNLGPSWDLLSALCKHQMQLESVCAALHIAQFENLKEAAQLASMHTVVADNINVLQGSVGVAGSSFLAPTLWRSAEELSDQLAVQEAKPWRAHLGNIIT
jgi:hypothetical protein